MRACGGVWVAHGSGDADREVVDERGMVRLPPDAPRYALKRLWLSEEEETGYYYGFANEGLWPLCHIVHARPIFRPEDWRQYAGRQREVRGRGARGDRRDGRPGRPDPGLPLRPAAAAHQGEAARRPRRALLAHPVAERRSVRHLPLADGDPRRDARRRSGRLPHAVPLQQLPGDGGPGRRGRIDWEHFSVARSQHVTLVKPFPISVAPRFVDEPPATSRAALLQELGIDVEFLGVGVERIDYTKGLPERFAAIRRFFTQNPDYRGRLTFVQLAAPSRSRITRYRALEEELDQLAGEINGELGSGSWRPIVLLKGHHDHRDVWPFYRWADFVMVTSLHDGMNLVAKEFVSVRDDGDGVLILSRFTGAARELRDALLVNPYDVDEMAEAIRGAVEMPAGERRSRMARMRQVVREHNIYRWAGRLLGELARLPARPIAPTERAPLTPAPGPGWRRRASADPRPRPAPAPAECGMAARVRRHGARGRAPGDADRRRALGAGELGRAHPRVERGRGRPYTWSWTSGGGGDPRLGVC